MGVRNYHGVIRDKAASAPAVPSQPEAPKRAAGGAAAGAVEAVPWGDVHAVAALIKTHMTPEDQSQLVQLLQASNQDTPRLS